MNRLLLLGLNHATAPLELREKLAFTGAQCAEALLAFKTRFPEAEAVLLSTCNRIELYAARRVHGHPRQEEMIAFLAEMHGVAPDLFIANVYQNAGADVVRHLFSVSSSLDSMVLGETQILGQVRDAYDLAHQLQLTGPELNPLFQKALAVGKQVMAQTGIADGRLGVASVAVDFSRKTIGRLDDKIILTIGAGEMAREALQSFSSLSPHRLLIANRDEQKARDLATTYGGQVAPFASLSDHLTVADIVITSTGSTHPIITREMFETILPLRNHRPILLIDIALPRDIDPAIGTFPNTFLHNIDDLQRVVSATQTRRQDAVNAAWKIVESEMEAFAIWQRTREIGPVIERLYARYHQMAQEELQQTLARMPDITDPEKSHLEDLSRRIVNKLLHDPLHMLKDPRGMETPPMQLLLAMERLFQTMEQPKRGSSDKVP